MEDTDLQRGQFTFYGSYYSAITRLPKCRQLELFQAICRYAFYGDLPVLTGASAAVFDMVVPSLRTARVKSAARLKELESEEAVDYSGVYEEINKNKNKYKNKIHINEKEKEQEQNKDRIGGHAAAAGSASECVFDSLCTDDPGLAEKLREYARHRISTHTPLDPLTAKQMYNQLLQFPKHERCDVVDQSIWHDFSYFRDLDYTYGKDRIRFDD